MAFICLHNIYTVELLCSKQKKPSKKVIVSQKNGSGTPNSTDNTVVLKKTENRSRKHKRKTWCCWIKTTLSVVYSGHCFLLSAIFKAQRCADSIKLQNENHTILFILELFFLLGFDKHTGTVCTMKSWRAAHWLLKYQMV